MPLKRFLLFCAMVSFKDKTGVNDRWMFIWVYPVLALLAVHIGNDNTFDQLLHIPSYYSDIAFALTCVYLTGWYFRVLF
ncbi:hypothetical protein SAMN06265379_11438 [Saccharicrinis carchari]|uniref:Uncharacterized protein n=2 Tax=Saccharicrinis carchari TaxID=1168039 RepID=A0A521F537_SACCC|nr:hypothetical protein SAMN06265379_11438 [Saccharicrinis carchari]